MGSEDNEGRLKALMGDLLFTIKEYSDKHERTGVDVSLVDRLSCQWYSRVAKYGRDKR